MKKFGFLICVLLLTSCSTLQSWFKPITRYDQKSYENFTSFKAQLNQFIDKCDPATPQEKIDEFLLEFNIMYEYEKGKGAGNAEVIQQMDLLRERISVFINEATSNYLSIIYKTAKKETLDRILDVIIKTEYDKPK